MPLLSERFGSTQKRALWLDFTDYAERLLGVFPWLEQASFAAAYGKAQGLLRSDVIALDVAPIVAAVVASRPGLQTEMAAKTRSGFPLKRLLEDAGLRAAVNNLLVPLRASYAGSPLVLVLPSPKRWLASAYQTAHGEPMAAETVNDADAIDGASVYVADFLRAFAMAGIDGVLLMEDADAGPADAEQLELYQPVINTARHYRWELGVCDVGKTRALHNAGLDFSICGAASTSATAGMLLTDAFWLQGEEPPAAPFTYGKVPVDMAPEAVLERLKTLQI